MSCFLYRTFPMSVSDLCHSHLGSIPWAISATTTVIVYILIMTCVTGWWIIPLIHIDSVCIFAITGVLLERRSSVSRRILVRGFILLVWRVSSLVHYQTCIWLHCALTIFCKQSISSIAWRLIWFRFLWLCAMAIVSVWASMTSFPCIYAIHTSDISWISYFIRLSIAAILSKLLPPMSTVLVLEH